MREISAILHPSSAIPITFLSTAIFAIGGFWIDYWRNTTRRRSFTSQRRATLTAPSWAPKHFFAPTFRGHFIFSKPRGLTWPALKARRKRYSDFFKYPPTRCTAHCVQLIRPVTRALPSHRTRPMQRQRPPAITWSEHGRTLITCRR